MSIFKRILMGIIRRPFKSLLLVLFTFSLGTFVGSSYLISKATNQVQKDIESKLDSYVLVKFTDSFYSQDFMNKPEEEEIREKVFDAYQTLKKESCVEMSNINLVSDSIISFVSDLSHPSIGYYHEIDYGAIQLVGLGHESMFEQQGIYKIVEGRNITSEDIDNKNKVVIIDSEYKYRDGSKINIGDKIRITYHYYDFDFIFDEIIFKTFNEIDYEFEVIGKYNYKHSNLFNMSLYPILTTQTSLEIMKNEIIQSNVDNIGFGYNPFYYDNYLFKLDSPINLNIFRDKYLNLMNETSEYINIKTSSDGYYEIKGTLDNMKEISNLIFFISGISSVFIGILVIYLYLKDRTNEVGILLSMGEKRVKILIQIVCEVLLLGLLGLSSSLYSSNIVGHKISSYVLNTQLEKPSKGTWDSTDAYNEIKNNYEIEIDDSFTYLLIGGGSIVLCISSCFPLYKCLKVKPKELIS